MIHRGHHASTAGTSTDTPHDWREHAACRDAADPEVFYPLGNVGSKAYEAAAAEARRICQQCPAIADCLEASLTEDDRHAIRGGLTPDERARQFPTTRNPCAVCGTGMGPIRPGRFEPRYCSDACRAEARRAAYARRKGVAA